MVHGRENGKRLERSRRCAGRQRQVHDNRCRTDPRPRRAVSGFVVRLTGQAGEDDQNNLRSRVLYTFLNDTYPLIHSGHVHNDYERARGIWGGYRIQASEKEGRVQSSNANIIHTWLGLLFRSPPLHLHSTSAGTLATWLAGNRKTTTKKKKARMSNYNSVASPLPPSRRERGQGLDGCGCAEDVLI